MLKKIYKSDIKNSTKFNYTFKFKIINLEVKKIILTILIMQDMNLLIKS